MAVTRLLLWMLVACALAAAGPRDAAAQDVIGTPGPVITDTTFARVGEWFTVRTLDGDEMQFSEFQGRVLFVNFWATWCAPCVEEMPTIVDLAESMADVDVAFLLISIDDDERLVRRFVVSHSLADLVYLRGWKTGVSTFTAGIVPATFVVRKDGAIVYQHHGAADWNTETIRAFLKKLVG